MRNECSRRRPGGEQRRKLSARDEIAGQFNTASTAGPALTRLLGDGGFPIAKNAADVAMTDPPSFERKCIL